MKEKEIKNLLQSNDTERLNFYLSAILSKSKDIEKENNKLGLMMIFLILLFYLIDYTKADTLNIGPISIKDLSSIKVFIPLVFSFLLLRYKVINSHKAELIRIVKLFSQRHFNFDNSNIKPEFTDDFTRTLLPISLYEEFNKLNYKGTSKFGCLGAIFVFPLSIGITLFPLFMEFIWLKEFMTGFKALDLYEKASIILTIWIIIIAIYYFVHTMIISAKEYNE